MPRVLLVDDQKTPRVALSLILETAGYEVFAASSGEEGLRLAAELAPDVIVLDVHMPGMDGFEVVARLKSDPATEPSPVIFLTAEPPTDDLIVRGLDLGAYDFISKECSRSELLARVGVMARIKRDNDELSAVARISDTLIQSLDPGKLSRKFVDQVRDVFRAPAALFCYSGDSETPEITSSGFQEDAPLIEALARSLHRQLDAADLATGEIHTDHLRGPAALVAHRHGFVTTLVTRAPSRTQAPTLLAVFSSRMGIPPHADQFFRPEDTSLLQLLASQGTIALDNAMLHERTRIQAIEMDVQAEKLERAMTERSRFFASMSHELRTPINAVIGYNQLLEIGAYGELAPEQAVAIGRLGRSANHLLELINDVLDISKMEAGKMEVHLEPVDLTMLIRETLATIQIQAEEKGLTLAWDAPPNIKIETDAARVRQILLNLLSNAVKFTEEGEVTVRCRHVDGGVEVEVRDTGVGIQVEDFDRVFEEFEQSARVEGAAGTGLGLPISRRLAHLLGGELSLRSEIGVGSTFILHLPTVPKLQRPIRP